jgi:hypothetical protein
LEMYFLLKTKFRMKDFLKKIFWRPIFRSASKGRNWFVEKYVIPPYQEKRGIIISYKEKYGCKTFVETGTFLGDTVEKMKNYFEKIISIELSVDLANKAKERFSNDSNITILQGDSGELIEKISNDIIKNPVLYWLDGHYSGSFYIGDEFIQTAEGNSHTPIMLELENILKKKTKDVILIDDARLFIGKNSYPTYEELIAFLNKLGVSSTRVSKKRDIIRIIPI